MNKSMSPYLLSEYLDIHEVASLSVEGRVLKGKAYNSNNDIKELERKLLNAVIKNEIGAKKYLTYNAIVFLFTYFYYIPNSCRIRMKPAAVTELYEKWGYHDVCFNPETTRPDSAPVFSESAPTHSKIPWIAPDNAFSELISELWKNGYIGADSYSDALKKTAPHFTVNGNTDTLRKGFELKKVTGSQCFPNVQPARSRKKSG